MILSKPAFLFLLLFLIGNAGFVFSQDFNLPVIENLYQEAFLYCSDPVAVAPSISIENIQVDEADEGIKISISNYIKGEDILEYDEVGSLKYSWDENSGYLEITGIGTDEVYEEAVTKVYYRNTSDNPTVGIRSLSITLRDADYLPATGHFYRFVKQQSISWGSARARAASMDYYGLKGYLATIRSKEEQDFIYTKTEGTGWIGASDEEAEGTWKWVEGPDKGVVFWSGTSGGRPVNGEYSHWGSGEPNNVGDEDYAHILYSTGVRGYWNDLPNGGSSSPGYIPQGFLIEYGGFPGEPELKLSAVANIEIRDSEQPVLNEKIFSSLFCGTMQADLQLAFINGSPETILTAIDNGVTVSNENTSSPTVQVPAYGNYSFQLDMTDEAGCSYIDTIVLGFHNQPMATFNLDEDECYGYNLQLAFTGIRKEDAVFTWYYNDAEFLSGINLDSLKIPLGFDDVERKVSLVVNEQGCIDTTTQDVKVKPDIIVSTENTEGCSPLTVNFSANTNKPARIYSWDFSDGSSSDEQNPLHTFINENDSMQLYSAQLTVHSDDGCENTAVYEDLVGVYPVPVSGFEPDSYEVLITDPEVTFTNTSRAATSFRWDFGDSTSVLDEINPLHRYDAMDIYPVTLESMNDFGCVDSIMKPISVSFDKLFPPNAFSPNANSEEDREFRIYSEGVADDGYQLLIFNRWGEIIFESSSQEIGWDGKMKNANFAPAGVYTWVVQYADFTGKKHNQQGSVTLIF
uniref:PKD domain-containing protein n=1 Tax=uncultured Draconibacterium sp. TaxID=1573823 RepID=UPI0032172363